MDTTRDNSRANSGSIHTVVKPMGPACNLQCDYCFYLEKEALFPEQSRFSMSDDVLESYIQSYISAQPSGIIEFVWQGGEPTLAGLDFYRKAVAFQHQYAGKKVISNSLQTNGILLNDEWCAFLKKNKFLVGLSLDGPEEIHDRYRRDHGGKPTFARVYNSLQLLRSHGVEFNIMASVARDTAKSPLEVYRFFKNEGIRYIQFAPIVERLPGQAAQDSGLSLAAPSTLNHEESNKAVTSWTVDPEEYGDFLIAIFDEWVRKDVGKTFVMNFEWAMSSALEGDTPICIFSRQCGRAVVVEHNGDVFACDHHVYPEYKLGNLLNDNLSSMVNASVVAGFGPHKETMLPRWCRECDVVQACWGGCPKHRFSNSPYGEPGLQYLCPGYRKYFSHISRYMVGFRNLNEYGLEPDAIMRAIDQPLRIPPSRKTDNQEILLWIK